MAIRATQGGRSTGRLLAAMVTAVAIGAAAPAPVKPVEPLPLPGLKPGATVRLGPGPYPALTFTNLRFNPPVTIEAGTTRVMGVTFMNSSGFIWRGGNVRAPQGRTGTTPANWGFHVRGSDGITIENSRLSESHIAIAIGDSRNIIVRNNRFANLRSDGVFAAGTSKLLVENNDFRDFFPIKATGSHAAGNWKDGDHPDAVQIFTTPNTRRVTDIIIRDNTVMGDMEGINMFGPKGDGYARIVIERNSVNVTYAPAISMFACDDCTIRDNRVWKIPGSPYQANIRFEESTGQACGNTMPDWKEHFAMKLCR